MGDREDKLSKAREKLEKFRKKKQKVHDPAKYTEDTKSISSTASSPVMFRAENGIIPNASPVVVAKPEDTALSSAPPDNGGASSPPVASLSSYFGVVNTDCSATGFDEIIANAPAPALNTNNSVFTLPPNVVEDFQVDTMSSVTSIQEDSTTDRSSSVSSYFQSSIETQSMELCSGPQTDPVIQVPISADQPTLLTNTSSISPNSDLEPPMMFNESSSLEPDPSQFPEQTKQENTVPESEQVIIPVVSTGVEIMNSEPTTASTTNELINPPSTCILTEADTAEQPPEAIELHGDHVQDGLQKQAEIENISLSVDNAISLQCQVDIVGTPTTTKMCQLESSIESVNILDSNRTEELSGQSSLCVPDTDVGSDIDNTSQILELQSSNQELVSLLAEADLEKKKSAEELALVKKQIADIRATTHEENLAIETRLSEENLKLKSELSAQSQTIELLVSQKSELETFNNKLNEENKLLLQHKLALEASVDQLSSTCTELRGQVISEGATSEMVETLKVQSQKEVNSLKQSIIEKDESYRELQSKLANISAENSSSQIQLAQVTSDLEMCKVHLTQLRGSGAQNLLNEKDAEIEALNGELCLTKKNLGEAIGRVEHLAGERELLAEQYRNYSRDLASQAERLSEQLRKFQDENARLLHREAGLVQTVAGLETQVHAFRKEGKNVTEEEIFRLKDLVMSAETELRVGRDEKEKMKEMLDERGNQVDEMGQRLAMRETKIMELQSKVSGLETTVDMLRSTSNTSNTDQAQLLAACQSDKVAASMAMQQNVNLKARLEELQGALVTLTNTKAELVEKLDVANKTISSCENVRSEIAARDEAVKEREIMLTNLRNQVRYLEEELSRRKTPDSNPIENNNLNAVNVEDNQELIAMEKELYQARDMIRNLNSQNSELRSKLEVLSSNTRDCSAESRCDSSSDGRVEMVESSLSDSSSDSFVELDGREKSSVASSDSFVNVSHVQKDEYEVNDVTSVEQTVIRTADLPFIPSQESSTSLSNSSLDNFESMKQLENRFVAAMEQLAVLSSDKEQLEHLVERLQEETETIGDYVIMYQHQRKMQKIKIQEKEDQVIQLAKDRAELLTKLTQLQKLVTNLVDDPNEDLSTATQETLAEEVGTKVPEKVSDKMASSMEKEKILELINEIGTDSGHIMARCENFEPWFWENSPSKVMTV